MGEHKPLTMIERAIRGCEKALNHLVKKENELQGQIVSFQERFKSTTITYASLKNVATKKAQQLKDFIFGYDEKEKKLRDQINATREQKAAKEAELTRLKNELDILKARIDADLGATDEIIENVFNLNANVLIASEALYEYVSEHVYKKLYDADGKLRSQVTLITSDGRRKIVATVSHISEVQADLANEALNEIKKFYDRFQSEVEADINAKALFNILASLLIEKKTFKVGPDLYKFLGTEIDDVFPELQKAQLLLRKSLRSKKTKPYILIKELDEKSNWVPVRQSAM